MMTQSKLKNIDYQSIAKLFSPVYIDHIANNDLQQIDWLVENCKNYYHEYEAFTLKEAYSYFYKLLLKHYKNEYVYKNLIYKNLILKNHKIDECVSIPEFSVGFSKADLAVFNGTSSVYEIKSDKDSTDRLSTQIADYKKFFEFVNVVVSEKHLNKVKTIVSEDVGIFIISANNKIINVREPISNIKNLDLKTLFYSLRKNEYMTIILKKYGFIPDVPNTLIFKECYNLFKLIDLDELHSFVVEILKTRSMKSAQIDLIGKLPESLKSISLSKRYNKRKCDNIIKVIETLY
ncbi:hypothetical protein M2347_000629 [Chryseobacterium sp. H1D6B]|uniref:sce7726 family protein n=1 Tax=Chryseobacterium sp. H1D6B TaxID=2940588 RepID=UPI0015C96B37|nr:sce7726 family protein [Chryseobacterium sp. H1D6B]MDH6250902.1 hypothetical protein [Chryseobacterium sp. H1D6B]